MKKLGLLLFCTIFVSLLISCAPSVFSNFSDSKGLEKYEYVVWPSEITGSRKLDYVMVEVCGALKATRLVVVSENQIGNLPLNKTLLAHCHVSQSSIESIVSIDFKDFGNDLPVLYVKGSFGMGWGKKDDMNGALKSLKKKLLQLFPKQ